MHANKGLQAFLSRHAVLSLHDHQPMQSARVRGSARPERAQKRHGIAFENGCPSTSFHLRKASSLSNHRSGQDRHVSDTQCMSAELDHMGIISQYSSSTPDKERDGRGTHAREFLSKPTGTLAETLVQLWRQHQPIQAPQGRTPGKANGFGTFAPANGSPKSRVKLGLHTYIGSADHDQRRAYKRRRRRCTAASQKPEWICSTTTRTWSEIHKA